MSYRILNGDVIEMLRTLPHESVDAVVTDPPYGIRFMGKAWDGADIVAMTKKRATYHGEEAVRAGVRRGHKSVASQAGKYSTTCESNRSFEAWTRAWSVEAIRVLKPGGHLLCFAATRTYHRMAAGVEDAGFEIRDQIGWLFGSGFPKSHNLDGEWGGWGTALKPAWEPIVLARKPLKGTVAQNVAKYGVGAINIAGCRIEGEPTPINRTEEWSGFGQMERPDYVQEMNTLGRWPANVIHDGSDEVVAAFPDAPGQSADVKYDAEERKTQSVYGAMKRGHEPSADRTYADRGATSFAAKPGARRTDEGSAARFFYCAKASREDRNEGCEEFDKKPLNWSSGTQSPGTFQADGTDRSSRNNHPTVKPTSLMRYLCRLITPPGGTVLDCFMGSGSTGKAALYEGFNFIGIEREAEYCAIAEARMRFVEETNAPLLRQVLVSE